jgi:hypothetical protein
MYKEQCIGNNTSGSNISGSSGVISGEGRRVLWERAGHLDEALDDIFVRLEAGGLSPQQTVREVMTRRTRRLCQYSRVPLAQLASHCATNWPRDFYRDQTFSWDLHALLLQTTSDFCPWSLESQAGQTLKSRVASLAGWPRWLGVTVPEATKNLTV